MTAESAGPSRLVSAIELAAGAALVIGHNVYRVLPNEVLILCAAGLVSARIRGAGWASLGLTRPRSWGRTLLIAVAAAALRIALGELAIDPVTARFWPPAREPAMADELTGNLGVALLALLLVWTFAAFGEEMAYRGYLLGRAADLGRRSTAALWIGVVIAAALFGYGHYYKGPAGVLDSGVAGLVLGAAYVLSGRNLWACVLAHGLIDTVGVAFAYLGWD